MNLTELWASYREGRCGISLSLFLGAVSTALGLLLSLFVLKPLVRAFSRKDIEKVFQARMRRTGFSLMVASVALGAYIACHAHWPSEVRDRKILFEVSELLLIVFSGYVFLEIVLSFF